MAEEEMKEESTPTKKDPKDMGFIERLDERAHRMDWLDLKLLAWFSLILGLVIGAHYPAYILPHWKPLLVMGVLFYIRPLKQLFA